MLVATLAPAHEPERPVTREIVWLKGHRTAPGGPLTLVALGADHGFAVAELKRFPIGEASLAAAARSDFERPRLGLQGAREVLARFAGARLDQTITILAERRPGGADLFVLTLDLCPAE